MKRTFIAIAIESGIAIGIAIASASAIGIGIGALLVIAALTVPVPSWRTGPVTQPKLRHSPPTHHAVKPARVWIDADAACGTGKRRDPDDCPALRLLANAAHIDITGISTVFGHAPVSEAVQ